MFKERLHHTLIAEWRKIRIWSRQKLMSARCEYMNSINGDELPPIYLWPRHMRRIFFKRNHRIKNTEVFQLILFFVGNGCSPERCGIWILLQHRLCTHRDIVEVKIRKRILQMEWIITNIENNISRWTYFDMSSRQIFYFNGRQAVNGLICDNWRCFTGDNFLILERVFLTLPKTRHKIKRLFL